MLRETDVCNILIITWFRPHSHEKKDISSQDCLSGGKVQTLGLGGVLVELLGTVD